MPYQPLKIRPGIDVELTETANELGWSGSNLIRWLEGMPEKLGGWVHLAPTPMIGTARGMHAWADLSGNPYLAIGSEQRLQVFASGAMNDITPLRKTSNPVVAFSTTINSKTVTIADAGHGAVAVDWINLLVPVSVGGIVLQGFYQVATVIDATSYTVQAASPATATATAAGAVPAFSAVTTPNLTVTLNSHGLVAGGYFDVQIATSVGGTSVPAGTYNVVAPVTTNTFVIQPGPTYNGSASENGGNARIQYLVPTGLASATALGGFGVGPFGSGGFGLTTSTAVAPLRQWFLDNWGQDFIGNYTGSPIYVWTPPTVAPALAIDTTNFPGALQPPTTVNLSFVSVAKQMVIALGCDPFGGSLDPNLVRWCDAGDRTNWQASAANLAGSFRIPSGSRIVGGIAAGNVNLLWTDIDLWSMTWQGLPFVWNFNKIAVGISLVSARAIGVYDSKVYWAAKDSFQMFDGSVKTLPCPVWDVFFKTVDRTQLDKVHCAVNSQFGEVTWFFQSKTGSDIDTYVTLHVKEGVWSYGLLSRTAWVDVNVLGSPIGVDMAGQLQQHETGYDADGAPMMPWVESGWMTLQEGTWFVFLDRVIPDFKVTGGSVSYEIQVTDFQNAAVTVFGPYSFNGAPDFEIVRARGRLFRIKIYSSGPGVFWRLGGLRYLASPAGRM